MTFAICAVVFVGCFLLSWRLGKFIKRCDERHEYVIVDLRKEFVVKEAERITREAAK